jgi:hypothetical protein
MSVYMCIYIYMYMDICICIYVCMNPSMTHPPMESQMLRQSSQLVRVVVAQLRPCDRCGSTTLLVETCGSTPICRRGSITLW